MWGRSCKQMTGIPAGKAPGWWAWRAAQLLSPPRSKSSLRCQMPWQKGRAGTTVAARLQPSIFKHSVRCAWDQIWGVHEGFILYHSIHTSSLCHIQSSPKKHLEAIHDCVGISIMLHLNRFGCTESLFLAKIFPILNIDLQHYLLSHILTGNMLWKQQSWASQYLPPPF